MPIREKSKLETIVPLVKTQLATSTGIDASLIFVSFSSDADLLRRAPNANFIAITPDKASVWNEIVTGGGNDGLWFKGVWTVRLFLRYAADVDFADDLWLLDSTNGMLTQLTALIHALQLFDPIGISGNYQLNEPMRLADQGWDILPIAHGNMATWGRLRSYWDVEYMHVV